MYATEVAGTTSVTLYNKNPLLNCAKNLENKTMTIFCSSSGPLMKDLLSSEKQNKYFVSVFCLGFFLGGKGCR